MATRSARQRRRTFPTVVAEMVDRRGWNPVSLLNTVDRLTPGRSLARLAASGVPYGPNRRHRADIWVPRASPEGPLPVLVFFYGGGWHAGNRGDYGFVGAALASQGFVTVIPDYRLVPTVRYPAFLWDAALAARWVARHIDDWHGDPTRIAVSGHSAGAYLAAMLTMDRRWLEGVNAAPDLIKAAALLSGPYDFAPFREFRGRNAFGHWPDPAETQPINYVRPDVPPMLLVHGSSDRLVYAKNSRHLAQRLAEAGAPVQLRIYQGANHADPVVALSRTFRRRLPVLADVTAFLRSALGSPT
mgnify:CR=1 FL=1